MVRYNKYEYLQHGVFPLWNDKKDKQYHEETWPFLLWFDTKSMNICNMTYSF